MDQGRRVSSVVLLSNQIGYKMLEKLRGDHRPSPCSIQQPMNRGSYFRQKNTTVDATQDNQTKQGIRLLFSSAFLFSFMGMFLQFAGRMGEIRVCRVPGGAFEMSI